MRILVNLATRDGVTPSGAKPNVNIYRKTGVYYMGRNWQSGTTSHGELLGHLAVAIAAFGTLIHIEQPDPIR